MNRHLKLLLIILVFSVAFVCCRRDVETIYTETDRTIPITEKITVDNGVKIHNQIFNLIEYDSFLNSLVTSDHLLMVTLKDFEKTTSSDKVVLALRYDIDDDINGAIKMAYREHKYGIKSTYFVLHTAKYYGKKVGDEFIRNDNVIYYLKKIQNDFGHELGFHNDLVTLQVMYGIPSREYLRKELEYLRGNGIRMFGTTYHGSPYCYIYKYFNAYFWKEFPDGGWNYEYVTKGYKTIKIEKDSLKNYNFEYEGGLLHQDYFFTDANFVGQDRWNMKMVNLDTIRPGKKVIIMLHPEHWDL
jgi:hypothetical protein